MIQGGLSSEGCDYCFHCWDGSAAHEATAELVPFTTQHSKINWHLCRFSAYAKL